ncbi:MAG: type II secretion system F family protein [Pseudomonadota bacterium]
MAQVFSYRAIRSDGREVPGTIGALSEADAVTELASRGLQVFEIALKGHGRAEPWYQRELSFSRTNASPRDLEQIASQLAMLLESGVKLTKALTITAENHVNRGTSEALRDVAKQIDAGESVTAAFESPSAFPELFRLYLDIGVQSNDLPATLHRAAEYFDTMDRNRRTTMTELIYPAILVAAAIGLVAFLSSFVAPNLVPLFEAANREPPLSLALLSSLNPGLVLGVPIAAISLVGFAVFSGLRLPSAMRTGLRSLVPKSMYRGGNNWQFGASARSLSHLLTAGIPLHRALSAVADAATDKEHRDLFRRAHTAVATGSSGTSAFTADPSVPALFLTLFAAGEQANSLPQTMATGARLLEARAAQRADRIRTLLTPAITLGVALVIGAMVFSIMQAILELGTLAY